MVRNRRRDYEAYKKRLKKRSRQAVEQDDEDGWIDGAVEIYLASTQQRAGTKAPRPAAIETLELDQSSDGSSEGKDDENDDVIEYPSNAAVGITVAGYAGGTPYFGFVRRAWKRYKSSNMLYTVNWRGRYVDGTYNYGEYNQLRRNAEDARKSAGSDGEAVGGQLEGRSVVLCPADTSQKKMRKRTKSEDQITQSKKTIVTSPDYQRDEATGKYTITKTGREHLNIPEIVEVEILELGAPREIDGELSEDDVPIGMLYEGWGDRAIRLMQSSLAESTKSSHRTALKAWDMYTAESAFSGDLFDWDPTRVDPYGKSASNEKIFMGFIMYCVTVRGVTVDTALRYKNATLNQLTTSSGIDLAYNQKWLRMKRFIDRARVSFPHDKKERLPMLQQHLIFVKHVIEQYNKECSDTQDLIERIKRRSGVTCKAAALGPLIAVLNHYGPAVVWVLLLVSFFGVSRAGDSLPQNVRDFDPTVDTTISDIRMKPYGFALHFKKTKTGRNTNCREKPFVRGKGCKLCAVSALEDYMSSYRKTSWYAKGVPSKLPLFVGKNGAPLATRDLRRMVKSCVEAMGLDPSKYGAHSLRIGGATAALAAPSGTEYKCKVLGYWSSSAVELYTRPSENMMVELVREMMNATIVTLVR